MIMKHKLAWLGIALALLLAASAVLFGCGKTFPVVMDATRLAINETGKILVEPALEKMCAKVAAKCKADGIPKDAECKPDDECRAKIDLYNDAAGAALDATAKLNRIWFDLEAAGLLK
jgi:hypothetical protein